MGRSMEEEEKKEKGFKRLLTKSLRKCYSLGSRSQRGDNNTNNQLPPSGCFSVYVGPEKERFVIRMAHVNHALFRGLLEEAESAYGHTANKGPLVLPCDVETFLDMLWEMERDAAVERSPICGLPSGGVRGGGTYRLLSPQPGLLSRKIRSKSFPPFSPLMRRSSSYGVS